MNPAVRLPLKLLKADEILYRFSEGRKKFWLRRLALRLYTRPPRIAFVNSGDTVLHAGVWRIETVEDWAECVGPEGHVIIIEADPQNAKILEIEKTRRGLDNTTIVNKAVWDKPEEIELLVSQISCRNKLRKSETYLPERPNDSFPEEKLVDADTIDNIIRDVGVDSVDHIHIQVSGAEIEAIRGMEETLRQSEIRVWMRAIHILEDSERPANEKVAEMLRNRGMTVVHAKEEPGRHGGNVYAVRY